MSQQPSMEEIIAKQKEQCIFCKIVKGEVPALKVYENDLILAIMDINPAKEGHVLVMPKEHYPLMPWVPRETFKELFKISKYIARAIEDVTHEKTQIFIASGGSAGQQSTHFMLHIMPEIKELKTVGNATVDSAKESQLGAVLKENLKAGILKLSQEDPSIQQFVINPEENKNAIAELFNSDEHFRNLILNDVDTLKREVANNPQLQAVFKGIDIDALSHKLQEMYNG
ncbi:MAG: HIT domain-containing protein [Candidatus Woesearchaeota archaeon]